MINLKFNLTKLLSFFTNNISDTKPAALNSNGLPFACLENTNDNLSEEATVNLLLFYINEDLEKAQGLADYLISNGLPFYDRASIVSEEPVTEGIIPYVSFKLAFGMYQLYLKTSIENYLNEYTRIIEQILSDGSIENDAYSSAIPLTVLIYNNGVLLNKRYGTYLSDVALRIWSVVGDSDKELETFNFIKSAQDAYAARYSNAGIFFPYYVRNLPENTSFGSSGDFVFDGILSNETDFLHQYKIFLNLANYYNYQYKKGSPENYYLKKCIDKFFDLVSNINGYPETISLNPISMSSSEISMNNNTISMSYAGTDVITYSSDLNFNNLVIYAKACLFLYEISKADNYLIIVEDIIEKILLCEQSNYSYKNDTYTDIGLQINILDLFASYNNLIKKNYYTLITDCLRLLNLEDFTPESETNHQQREVINILKNSINELWGEDEYIEIDDLNIIPDYIEPRWYMVLKYHMAWQLALTRGHELSTWFEKQYMQMFAIMSQRKDLDLIFENQMPTAIDYASMNTNIWGNMYA